MAGSFGSEEEDFGLKVGETIDSAHTNYVVMRLLGTGGFGAVFLVQDQKHPILQYALKVEKKMESRRHSKLKMEIAILKMVSHERAEGSHFTRIIDRGKKEGFFFLVMQLVGESLADLKENMPHKVFSFTTGAAASMQCLEAVQDLHKYGFIHRDIKPANFAVGLGNHRRIVYILDFGIARKILNDKGEVKAPRKMVGFKGTIKFAAIACHARKDLGFKDDCECWFYLMLDLLLIQGLPWRKFNDKDEVKRLKIECRSQPKRLFVGLKCKEEFGKILNYIDSLHYEDLVDYNFIYTLLNLSIAIYGGSLNDRFDWEKK